MNKLLIAVSAFALAGLTGPLAAQDPTTTTGSMSATDVGVSPLTGTSATDYVKLAADGDNYEVQSSKIALSKSKSPAIKGFAKQMISDHMTTTKSLTAALTNPDRKIATPSMMLSSDNASKIALLKKTPKKAFDQIYLQQQMQAHQSAWALHKGYATDGTDPALKQVASTALPIVEGHLSMLKGMMPPASM